MPDSLTHAVRRAIAHGLVSVDHTVIVALSGGADSTALTLALAGEGIEVVAAHYNHRLRGKESDADELAVRELAAARGLALVVGADPHPPGMGSPDRNVEQTARQRRYRFLGHCAREHNATHIAVGHTLDDQFETLLIRLIRGTGPTGLSGMAPLARIDRLTGGPYWITRPLLGVSHAATLAYCAAHEVTPVADQSNESTRFLRNRVRRGIVPAFVRENPRIVADTADLMALLRDQQQFIRQEVERRWGEVSVPGEGAVLRREVLARWPAALASEAVRVAAEHLVAPPSPLEYSHIVRLLGHVRAGEWARLHLPAGLEALVDRVALRIRLRQTEAPPSPVRLEVPGSVQFGHWRVHAERRTADQVRQTSGPGQAWVHSAGPFEVRSRRPGDRYRPFGRGGSVTLQDDFVNRKVPREERPFLPVVTSHEQIVWTPGGRIAQCQEVVDGEPATLLRAERVGG
ncbi:MAG: tRNA lysidine(34) synthetase TilS [Dehalococcoidia bacterium]